MSVSEETVDDLIGALARGDLSPDEFRERLRDATDAESRDELWARWAQQGIFDGPISQDGFTSIQKGVVREVRDNG